MNPRTIFSCATRIIGLWFLRGAALRERVAFGESEFAKKKN